MPQKDYNRYSLLNSNEMMPYINIPQNASDKYEIWNVDRNRLDKICNKYYGNPFYDFLILYANGFMSEFDIPDGQLLRIPFPLSKARADYENALLSFRDQ